MNALKDKMFWMSLCFLAVFSFCLVHAIDVLSISDQSHDLEDRVRQLENRIYTLENTERRSFRNHDLFCDY